MQKIKICIDGNEFEITPGRADNLSLSYTPPSEKIPSKNTGVVFSKQLWKYVDGLKKSHSVGSALHDNIKHLDGAGYIFFDINTDGEILALNERHTVKMSVFKWARHLLVNNIYPSGFVKKMTVWEYYGIKDRDVEIFGNYIKGLCRKHNYTIDVLDNKNIKRAFTMRREATGRLFGSCMNNYPEYFDMLQNCDDISTIIVLDDQKKLIGRSLLWNVDIGQGKKISFMDRFYTSRDYLDGVLIDYAQENGLWRRFWYDRFEGQQKWVSPDQSTHNVIGSIELPCEGYKYYPFLDTFQYGGSDFISNSSFNCKYMYLNTLGDREVCKTI